MRCQTISLNQRLLLFAIGAATVLLCAFLQYQPTFYRGARNPDGDERAIQSGEFAHRYSSLMAHVDEQDPDWQEVFMTEQINAFLRDDFLKSSGGANKLPDGFQDLRVQVEEGKLRLGCRYEHGLASTVLSIEAKVWLVEGEVNQIGVELSNLRAGAFPVSRQIILDYISEAAARSHIEVAWRYDDDNPVAILRLQADPARPAIQVQRFELHAGSILIAGRSFPGGAGN
jgi:hypothetical protein